MGPLEHERDWAHERLDRFLREAPENQRHAWSALRDRTLVVTASGIGLSVLVVTSQDHLVATELIKAAWIVLLLSLFLGFVSLYFDHRVADKNLESAKALKKLTAGVATETTVPDANKAGAWIGTSVTKQVRITNYSLYLSAALFFIGVILITAFAWQNVD